MLTFAGIIKLIKDNAGAFKILGIVVLLLVIIFGARACYVNYQQEQRRQEQNELRQQVIDATIQEELANSNAIRKETEEKGKNTNEARKDVNTARNTDSSASNSNAAAVKQRYCQLYPDDSLCK